MSRAPSSPGHPESAEDSDIAWSTEVLDLESRDALFAHEPERQLPTASIGKVLLLIEMYRQAEDGLVDLAAPLPLDPSHEVADSGLLHLFRDRSITIADACLLVGAVSDNFATNALIDLCGLGAVQATTRDLGLTQTALLDVIRDDRGPQHPPAPSHGTAGELAQLFARLHAGTVVSPEVSAQVLDVLSAGTDTSMVAGGLHLDPLAHCEADGGVRLWHKTGHDAGVRADAGIVTGPAASLAYAVIARWAPEEDTGPTPVRIAVEDHMRAIGAAIRDHVLDTEVAMVEPREVD